MVNIADYVERSDISISESMKQVLQVMENVNKLPSCNKVASGALLNSCSALEGTVSGHENDISRGPDLLLDEAKSIYAARLAVCELSGAKAPVPQACKNFLPTEKNTRKAGIRGFFTANGPSKPTNSYQEYELITEQDLDNCLAALESRPQWWTSYSNARQNAIVMCHAMRSEVEKDEQLHLFKVMSSSNIQLAGDLAAQRQELATATEEWQKVQEGMRQFHLDLHANQEAAKTIWAQMIATVQAGIDGIKATVHSVNDDLDEHRKSLHHTGAELSAIGLKQRQEAQVLSKTLDDNAQLATYMKEILLQGIAQELGKVHDGLQVANQDTARHGTAIALASDQVFALASDVQELRESVETLEKSATKLVSNFEWLMDAMTTGWAGSLPVILRWAASFIVTTLFSYAFWSSINVMPLSAVISASLASGFCIPPLLSSCIHQLSDSKSLWRYFLEHAIWTMPGLIAICSALIWLFVKIGVWSKLRSRLSGRSRDPNEKEIASRQGMQAEV